MRILLALFLSLSLSYTVAQGNYLVEKVLLTNSIANSKAGIPRLKDVSNAKNPIVTKVNEALLEMFGVSSYTPSDPDEFRWSDIEFRSQIKNHVLFITFSGEYYGASLNHIEDEEMYFDLTTGALFEHRDIPFEALFSLKGYFDFMNKFWLPKVKPLFKEAITCADIEPYCSYYDIDRYDYGTNNQFTCSLVADCFPNVVLGCSPAYTLTISGDSLRQYLSDFGKTLVRDNYTQLGGVEKVEYVKKTEGQVPDNIFLNGKLGGKYEFSMAITINRTTHKAEGYYYYEKRKVPIALSGDAGITFIQLSEMSDGKVTGKMSFTLGNDYTDTAFLLQERNNEGTIYVSGVWKSPDEKTSMDIIISEIKLTNRIR